VQNEERYRVKSSGSADRQSVDVSTLGLLLSAVSEADFGTFTYGFDGYLDFVDSANRKYDADGNLTGEAIQGPVADDSEYTMLGLYVKGEFPIVPAFVLEAGLRGNWIEADVGRMEDPETGKPTSFTDRWSGLVGSLRFRWDAAEPVGIFGGISQGFRAPNLSDLTRLDSARSNEFGIPSPGLDPETALSFELGARLRFPGSWITLSLFDTELSDLIVRVPTGEEVDGEFLVTKENVGDGYCRGVELAGDVALGSGFALFGGGTWMTGKADTYPTSERIREREYLDRLPPLMGNLGLRWVADPGLFAMARIRAAADADRLSTRDEGDTQRIPPGGTPGYVVLDLETRIPLAEGATATVGIENLFDADYRIHGSGTNMPGRNFYLTVEFRF
jgi:hemoglobin/transferrin/lactoferrin receptor protein